MKDLLLLVKLNRRQGDGGDPQKLEFYIKQLIGWYGSGIEPDSCLPIFALYVCYYSN